MKKLNDTKSLLAVTVLLVILIVTATFQIVGRTPRKEERKHVSMIVFGEDSERWENMRQGAGLVCSDNDADLSMLTMMSENDVGEQEEIIEREIAGGADALIIAPCNSNVIEDYINRKKPGIPVVFIGSFISKDTVFIAPDDYQIGYDLGEEIVKNESDIVTVAIISENTQRDSVVLREKGLRDAIDGKVGKVIDWTRSDKEGPANTQVYIQKALVTDATDVIVTLDNSTGDALLDALENLNQSSKVYSISTSNQAVYYLYNKEIKALEYTNEFSMGYLAAVYAIDSSYAKKKYPDEKIDHRLVRKENMYDKDNQTLLFPFVD